ncbi:MAG: PEPxxWA-CTERM sorting domain-containing protein [Caulobacteraceae bacterium]|nr:PEPxxWA-CTERM sorting domain-containing protein [Caulobacteraceae bacterium]
MLRALKLGAAVSAVALIGSGAQAAQVKTVFNILLENHNFTQPSSFTGVQQLFGNPAAPFLNSLVTPGNPNAAMTSYATNYTNVDAIHPSEPNYVYAESGVTGPLNDADPYPSNIVNAPNLTALLQSKGVSWTSYAEDIDLANTMGQNASEFGGTVTSSIVPSSQNVVPLTSLSGTSASYTNPYNGSHQYNFAAKHDGPLFFTATNGGNNPTPSNTEASHYLPLQDLAANLASNNVSRFNYITPDQYNDMHSSLNTNFTYNGVTYAANTDQEAIALGDHFLSIIVPEIEASQAFKNDGAIVIWNDESEGGNGPGYDLTEIVISPLAKGNAFAVNVSLNHASDLKTWEELFGVGPLLGGAAAPGVNTLAPFFQAGAIPEPGTWAMMILGLGLTGACLRRRPATSFAG